MATTTKAKPEPEQLPEQSVAREQEEETGPLPTPNPTSQWQALSEVPEATVFERMVAVIAELPAIGKTQENKTQNFMFRGHDDVMNALNPLLARHGVFVVPHVLERVALDTRTTANGKTMYEVDLHVQFTVYGMKGDCIVGSAWGEGTDMGDKSTSKAMTMAFKYFVAETFALSTAEASKHDADADTPEETSRGVVYKQSEEVLKSKPPQNWSDGLKRFDTLVGSNGDGAAWLEELVERRFSATSLGDLSGDDRKRAFVGFGSTLMLLEDEHSDLGLSENARIIIQAAFALKNEGIALEGPPWALSGAEAEQGRPSKDDYISGKVDEQSAVEKEGETT